MKKKENTLERILYNEIQALMGKESNSIQQAKRNVHEKGKGNNKELERLNGSNALMLNKFTERT